MNSQFKYALKTALHYRGIVFAVIFTMNTIFITLGSLGMLPFAALVTAVSLGGIAIAVMLAASIVSDVMLCSRMFAAPGAYLYMLTPSPRWKILLSSVITMFVLDFVTMTVVITQQVWLSLNLAGVTGLWDSFKAVTGNDLSISYFAISGFFMLMAGYLLYIMVILFCITVNKSILYKKPASGLLTFLTVLGCIYAISLLQILLLPFGTVQTFGLLIIINLNNSALPFYSLLLLLEAAGLFILTAKLLEKKINI